MTTGISSSMYAALENSTATSRRKLKRELKKAGVYDKSMKPLLKVQAAENRMQQVALTGELDLKDKLKNKLIKAGYTTPEGYIDIARLQKMVSEYIGSDNNTNYQTERKNLIAEFNDNDNKVEFSKKEVLKIVKALGANYEKKFNWWKAIGVGLAGAAVGAAIGSGFKTKGKFTEGDINNSFNVNGGFGNITENTQIKGETHSFTSRVAIGAGAIAGFIPGFAGELIRQAQRNEKSVTGETSTEKLLKCKTLKDFKLCADKIGTKKGKEILKEIATFYADEAGNLDTIAMAKDMMAAAGTNSVLNEVEALKMLGDLHLKGRPEHEEEVVEQEQHDEPEPTPTPAPVVDTPDEPTPAPTPTPVVEQEEDEPCYEVVVQNNESPAMLAKKYGVSVEEILELNKSQVKKFKDCNGKIHLGFLVGAVIQLPCDAKIENARGNLTSKQSQNLYENIFVKKADKGDVWCEEKQATRKELYDKALENALKKQEAQKTE